jgi:hypothetical protein
MIDHSVLFQAKTFLCWDRFPDLEIKLIPIQTAVAFFYPPKNKIPIIHLYYQSGKKDFTESLCFLFHEVGHYLQWDNESMFETEFNFFDLIDKDKGEEKILFELQAWDYGLQYLEMFLDKENIEKNQVIKKYEKLKKESLKTYSDKIDK